MKWLILIAAIISEAVATSALKSSEGFTKLVPSAIVVAGYALAFYLLSISLRYFNIGIVYAIWSGVGIVLIAVIGHFLFRQHLDAAAFAGMALIIAGVVVINLFSKSIQH